MASHDFDGPVTNDKTAIFFKTAGVTATSNLVASLADDADNAARWATLKTWAGNDDADVRRLSASVTEMPDFHAPPNRINVETYDADNQSIQVLGIGTTPDLDLTVSLFNPAGDEAHAELAGLAENSYIDIAVITATSWKADNAKHIDGTALKAAGYAIFCQVGKPFAPGGQANDFSRLTVPLAFKGISQRLNAS